MILGLEVAMFIGGLIALIRGRLKLTGTKEVVGPPARLIGLAAMMPLSIFGTLALYIIATGDLVIAADPITLALVEGGTVIVSAVLLFVIGSSLSRPIRKETDDDDDDEYEDDEYEDDDDRPRRKKRRDDDE